MLTESTARRKRLLAEAYPMLKTATDGGIQTVKFANVLCRSRLLRVPHLPMLRLEVFGQEAIDL